MQTNIRNNNFNRKFCTKCNRYGNHTESLCNEAIENICFYCAHSHPDEICRFIICSICAGNHPESRCMINERELRCSLCNTLGHIDELCPNNWRVFHSVTSINNIDNIDCPVYKENMTCPGCGFDHLYYKCPDLRKKLMNYNPKIEKEHIDAIKQRYINAVKRNNESNSDKPCCSKQLNNSDNNTETNTETNTEIHEISSSSSSDYNYEVDKPTYKSFTNYYNKQRNDAIKDNLINSRNNKRKISAIDDNESSSMDNSSIDDDNSTINNDISPFDMNSSINKLNSRFNQNNSKKFKNNNNSKLNRFNNSNDFNNSHNKFYNSLNRFPYTKKNTNPISYPNLNIRSNSMRRSNFNNSNSNLDYFKKRNKYPRNQNNFNQRGSYRPNYFNNMKKR